MIILAPLKMTLFWWSTHNSSLMDLYGCTTYIPFSASVALLISVTVSAFGTDVFVRKLTYSSAMSCFVSAADKG